MNILNIAKKEIIQNLRNKSVMIIMCALPIFLIFILGVTFSSMMNGSKLNLDEMWVPYSIDEGSYLSEAFEAMTNEIKIDNLSFSKAEDKEEAKELVRKMKAICFIEVDGKENTITIYKNDRFDTEVGLVESVLSAFVDKYNVMALIYKDSPESLERVMKAEDALSYVDIKGVVATRKPNSMDYFGIVITSLFILYSIMTGYASISDERSKLTGNRLTITPISKGQIFLGKLLGCIVITVIQASVVLIVSKIFLKVYWGENPVKVLFMYFLEIIMAVSIGIGFGMIFRNKPVDGLLHTLIPVMAFFGGSYAPIEQFGTGMMLKLSYISPVRWVNGSIFESIYSNSNSFYINAVIILSTISVIFLVLSSIKFRRAEVF